MYLSESLPAWASRRRWYRPITAALGPIPLDTLLLDIGRHGDDVHGRWPSAAIHLYPHVFRGGPELVPMSKDRTDNHQPAQTRGGALRSREPRPQRTRDTRHIICHEETCCAKPNGDFAPNAMLVSARAGTVPRTDRWLSDRGVSPATRGGVGFRARTHGASAVFLSAGETKRSLPRSLHARARARTHHLGS